MANNDIYMTLDLPGFKVIRDAIEVVSFTCNEGINRIYRLEIIIGVDVKDGKNEVRAGDFIGQAARLAAFNKSDSSDYDSEKMKGTATGSAEDFVDGSSRLFTGRISECQHLGDYKPDKPEKRFFLLTAFPDAVNLTRNKLTTSYVLPEGDKLTPKKCIEDLLTRHKPENVGEGKQPIDYNLNGIDDAYPLKQMPSCVVQFRESDFDFLLRWIERQGWFFRFRQKDTKTGEQVASYTPETLVFQSAPKLERLGLGKSQLLRMAQGSDMKMGVHTLRTKAVEYPGQIQLQDYNPEVPGAELLIIHPESPRKPGLPVAALKDEFFGTREEGEALAKIRMETYEAHSERFEGLANVPGMAPGLSFLLYADAKPDDLGSVSKGALDSAWIEKSYFITGAMHAATSNRVDSAVADAVREFLPALPPSGYSVRFNAVRYSPAYHPEKTAAWPKITQTAIAFVLPLNENDRPKVASTAYNRYYVSLSDVTPSPACAGKPGSIGPVRLLQSDDERFGGSGVSIDPGSEVILSFTDGNPDRAVISGSIPNDYSKTYHYFNQNGVGLGGNEATQGQQILNSVYSPINNIKDSGGGNTTSIGASKGSAPAIQVDSKSGSKDVYVLSSYLDSKTTTISAASSGMTKSSANFTNAMSVSSGTDQYDVIALLDELQKKVMEVKSEVSGWKGGKLDYTADGLTTISCKLAGQVKTISKLVKAFLEFGDSQSMSQRERVSIISAPGKASITMRSIILKKQDKIVQLTKISSELVSDVKTISSTCRQMKKTIEDLYGSDAKRKSARESFEKSMRATMDLPEGAAVPVPASEQALRFLTHLDFWTHTSVNLTSIIKDLMLLVKFFQHVIRQDVGNSGIRIQACGRKGSDAREKLSDTVAKIKAKNPASLVGAPETVKKVSYNGEKGLNLQLLADGPVRLKSEENLYVGVYKESVEPFTKEPSDLTKKAVVQMGRDLADKTSDPWTTSFMRVAVEELGVNAKSMSTLLGDGGLRIESVDSANKSRLSVQGRGGFRLTATDEGMLDAKKALHVSTEGDFSALGKSLTLASTGAGISLGFVDGKKPAAIDKSKPYIGLAAVSRADAAKFIKAKETLQDKEQAFAEKFTAYRGAKEKLGILGERVSVVWDELAKDDSVKTQTLLTDAKTKYSAAKTDLDTKTKELAAAKKAWETALTALENIKGSSANKNLIMTNGEDAKQSLVISDKGVWASSDKEINLKAGNTVAKFSASSVEIKCGQKVTIKGSAVDIG